MITTNSVAAVRGDANPASNLDMNPAGDEILLRSMKAEDLAQVESIEKQSFSQPWSRQSFQAELDTSEVSQPMVAVRRGEVVGYVVPWYVADELQIANLAVRPDCRKQGIGTALLSVTLESARQQNCTAAYLEVRASNPALEFYEKMGFQQSGRRREYYHPEHEDAVLMQKPLV